MAKDISKSKRNNNVKFVTKSTETFSKRSINKNLITSNKPTSIKKNSNYNSEMMKIIPKKKLDNFELNNLEYDMALQLDKRSFIKMYWSILRRENLIIFTFFIRNDYNLIYVKLSRFVFLVCTDMALNVFFFADETMHKMYIDYGKYNFFQNIPQFIYSTIVSQLIQVFLCFLSMTDKHFYEIKQLSSDEKYKMFDIIKCVKIKLTFYFIFTFIMFAFYWYTIACFWLFIQIHNLLLLKILF